MYNVTTDHGFPFFMYSAQQDSGTVATPIFGRGGQITYRDWYTTNGFETAQIIPDPADPNYLYATGWYGSVLRDQQDHGPDAAHFRAHSEVPRKRLGPPMGFSPLDPNTLYLATQYLLATHDKGMNWEAVSPGSYRREVRRSRRPDVTGRSTIGRGPGPAISALAFSRQVRETDLGGDQHGADPTDARCAESTGAT